MVTVTGEQLNPMISRIFSVFRNIWTPGPAHSGSAGSPRNEMTVAQMRVSSLWRTVTDPFVPFCMSASEKHRMCLTGRKRPGIDAYSGRSGPVIPLEAGRDSV